MVPFPNNIKPTPLLEQISVEDLSSQDAIIIVIGPAGSGKSFFIEKATGIKGIAGLPHDLSPGTDAISVIRISCPEWIDSAICFIDTPGLDGTLQEDAEIFKMISDSLINMYKRHIQLTGLLYFHRISDNRILGANLKNLRVLEHLCGENFNNIVITTTMWSEVEEEMGILHERSLKDGLFKPMMNRGSSIKRFLQTRESAFDVLAPIFKEFHKTKTLLLQKEMVYLDKKLKKVSAGKSLYLKLGELITHQQTLLGKIRVELNDSKYEPDDLQELIVEYQKVSGQLQRVIEDLKRMKITIGDSFLRFTRPIDLTRFMSIPAPLPFPVTHAEITLSRTSK